MSIARNTQINLIGAAAPLLINLITLPLFLRLVGAERYGVLTIVWIFLGYFALFDIGTSRAISFQMARTPPEETQLRGELFWTGTVFNLLLGILGGLITIPVGLLLFGHTIGMSGAIRDEALQALPIMAVAVPVATVSGAFVGTLQGNNRFLALNVIQTIAALTSQLLPIAVAYFLGPRLSWLVAATLASRAVFTLQLFISARAAIQPSTGGVVWQRLGALLRFGGWVAVSNIIGPVLYSIDRVVVGALSGAARVTYYAVPFNLLSRANLLSNSLSGSLFPRLAAADDAKANELCSAAVTALSFALTPSFIGAIFLLPWFLGVWVGPAFAQQASLIGKLLTFGIWVNGMAAIPYALLEARGRPDVPAKCHLVEVLPYLGLLWLLTSRFGAVGAAAAWSLRGAVDGLLLFRLARARVDALRTLLVPGGLIIAALLVSTSSGVKAQPWLEVALGLFLIAVAALWGWNSGAARIVLATSWFAAPPPPPLADGRPEP